MAKTNLSIQIEGLPYVERIVRRMDNKKAITWEELGKLLCIDEKRKIILVDATVETGIQPIFQNMFQDPIYLESDFEVNLKAICN